MTTTQFLSRPDGRIAYDDQGSGPLVVCVPAMGDTRAEYRALVPQLTEAGFRVVTMDLRGHGDSDTTFTDVERTSAGADVAALLAHLDAGPAHLIGCSYGAGAVVWAAAEVPSQVTSLTLIGPFVRQATMPRPVEALMRLVFGLLLRRPWGPAAWAWWYPKMYPGRRPADLSDHIASVRANLAEDGRLESFRAMTATDCRDIEPRLAQLSSPVTIIMGTDDPDFPDPAGEAHAIAEAIRPVTAEIALIQGAGHHPHAEDPHATGTIILRALARATERV